MVKKSLFKMGKHMLTNKGFTLIETLFVLFIICLLSVLTMGLHIPTQSDEMILEEISQFINQAKMNAMIHKETTYIIFSRKSISIDAVHYQNQYLLPNEMYFDEYKMSYNEFGNIKIAKKIVLHCQEKSYSFVFQIGSGSYYVE